MNRRKFLQWIGLGGTVVMVPALAAIPESPISGAALMAKYFPGPTIGEAMAESPLLRGELGEWVGFKIITSENGPEIEWIRARDFYAPPDAVAADTVMIDGEPHYMMQVHPNSWLAEQWTEKEQAAMRLQERRPLAINKIAGNRKSSMTVGD